MIILPTFNPVALQLGPVKIHWYGLMYLFGFAAAWCLAVYRARSTHDYPTNLQWSTAQISDLVFYVALGVIIGGRLGYMLFYNFPQLLADPISLFKIWQGGMSFHGGFLGVLLGLWYFSYQQHKPFFSVTDFVAPLVAIGLGAGRIGNFINGELLGRVTDMPWGMVFPNGGPLPRHPSQLYELALEGILLFILLWWYSAKPRPRGNVSSLFLLGYGSARFFVEFFRTPDQQLGFVAFNWLTMGQLLSLPMILLGIYLLTRARAQEK